MANIFKNAISKRTDEELTKIINSSPGDYQTEAIQAAEQEIKKRRSIAEEQSTYSDEQLLEILSSKNKYQEYEIQTAEIELEKRKKIELPKDEEKKNTEMGRQTRMNEDNDYNPFEQEQEDANKCIICEEDPTRSDLYMIWQNANFKGVAEIGICNECIKPYLPRKTGKLFGAILFSILWLTYIILPLSGSVEIEGFNFNWFHIIMLLYIPYQVYQWFSDYAKSGDVTKVDNAVLQVKLVEVLGKTKQIKETVIINWEALKAKQLTMKVAVTDFTDTDFLASVRTPISIATSSNASRIDLEVMPETYDYSKLPKYFNDEDKEFLIESVNHFKQEKMNKQKEKINALQKKYLNKSN